METRTTVGLDRGDKNHSICVLDPDGNVVEHSQVANTAAAIRKRFGGWAPCLVALEAGTHSAWVSGRLRFAPPAEPEGPGRLEEPKAPNRFE